MMRTTLTQGTCWDCDLVVLPSSERRTRTSEAEEAYLYERVRAYTIGRDPAEPPLRVFIPRVKRPLRMPPLVEARFEFDQTQPHAHRVRRMDRHAFPVRVRCVVCGIQGEMVGEEDKKAPREWDKSGVCMPTDNTVDLAREFYVSTGLVNWRT